MRSVCWQLVEFCTWLRHTHGATKRNHVLFCGPLFQAPHRGYFIAYNWNSWLTCVTTHIAINILLFPQWPVESLWNQGHHSYVVVWCLFLECELKNFEAFHGWFLKVHNYESCILWHQPFQSVACIHLEWILKHHSFIASRATGTQIFQKSRSHLKILGAKSVIWSTFSYWQSINMLQYKMLLQPQPCARCLCNPAWVWTYEYVCMFMSAHTVPQCQNLAVRCAC